MFPFASKSKNILVPSFSALYFSSKPFSIFRFVLSFKAGITYSQKLVALDCDIVIFPSGSLDILSIKGNTLALKSSLHLWSLSLYYTYEYSWPSNT